MNDGPFEIVFVCTGNRFRSPLAAAFLLEAIPDVPLCVRSLGTRELGSIGALSEAVELAGGYGVDLSAHSARGLRDADLTQADLVVGFERKHIAAAVVDAGAAAGRAFTLPELVELLERIRLAPGEEEPVRRARAAVASAHALRSAGPQGAKVGEIRDPLGLAGNAQREIAAHVYELTRRLAAGLFGFDEVRPTPAVKGTGSRRGWFRAR